MLHCWVFWHSFFKHTQAKHTLWPLFSLHCAKQKQKKKNPWTFALELSSRHPLAVATVNAGNTARGKKEKSCCAHHHHRRPPGATEVRRVACPCVVFQLRFLRPPRACFAPLAMDLSDCSRWNAVVLYLRSMFSKACGRAACRTARQWIRWDLHEVNQCLLLPSSHIYFSTPVLCTETELSAIVCQCHTEEVTMGDRFPGAIAQV